MSLDLMREAFSMLSPESCREPWIFTIESKEECDLNVSLAHQ